jgi:hypothetical protein
VGGWVELAACPHPARITEAHNAVKASEIHKEYRDFLLCKALMRLNLLNAAPPQLTVTTNRPDRLYLIAA